MQKPLYTYITIKLGVNNLIVMTNKIDEDSAKQSNTDMKK